MGKKFEFRLESGGTMMGNVVLNLAPILNELSQTSKESHKIELRLSQQIQL